MKRLFDAVLVESFGAFTAVPAGFAAPGRHNASATASKRPQDSPQQGQTQDGSRRFVRQRSSRPKA